MSLVIVDTAYKYAEDTVTTSAVGLVDLGFTNDDLLRVDSAIITVRTAEVFYRLDGGNPTSTSHSIASGATVTIEGRYNLRNLKLITSSGTANLAITLLKRGI